MGRPRLEPIAFFSDANLLDFGPAPDALGLPELTMVEEAMIAHVHVAVSVHQVRGEQYKYRGHVCQFFRNIAKVCDTLPTLPEDLDIIVIKPSVAQAQRMADDPRRQRQFRTQFKVRRRCIQQWLEYLKAHHEGYRDITISLPRLADLPEDGDVADRVPTVQSEEQDRSAPAQGAEVRAEGQTAPPQELLQGHGAVPEEDEFDDPDYGAIFNHLARAASWKLLSGILFRREKPLPLLLHKAFRCQPFEPHLCTSFILRRRRYVYAFRRYFRRERPTTALLGHTRSRCKNGHNTQCGGTMVASLVTRPFGSFV